MKFGDFLFPDCRDPADDGRVIRRDLAEAPLAKLEVIWLAEHHFDGIAVYADPNNGEMAEVVPSAPARHRAGG